MAKNIEVKILGDADPLRRSLSGASRNVQSFEGHLGKAGRGALSASGAFSHLGRSIAFASGAFLGAAGFTSVVKQSVEGAMSLERELEKTRAVFGANSRAIERWSTTTARSFGVSRGEALKSATLFGQMAHSLGLTSRQGVNMARVLTELAPKLALFAGKSTEEASAALAGGLAGRTRALKTYGIVIDSTTLKAEAMRLGLVKSNVSSRAVEEAQTRLSIAVAKAAEAHRKYGDNTTQVAAADLAVKVAHDNLAKATSGVSGQLTGAAKAQAFFSLVQGQSKAASETWRREQGSGEVQIKRLKAELKDTEVVIGQALLPIVTDITKKMANWLGKTENQKTIQHDLNKVVQVGGGLLHDLHDVVKALTPVVQAVNGALGGTKRTVELLIGLAVVGKLSRWAGAFRALAGAEGIGGAVTAIRGKGGLMSALNSLPASKVIAIRLVGVAGAILALKELGDRLFHAGDNAPGMKAAREVGIDDTLAKMLNNPTAAFRAWARQWALNNGRGDIAFGLLIDDPKFNKAARAWVAKHSSSGGGTSAAADSAIRKGTGTTQQGVVSTALSAASSPGAAAASFHLPGEASPWDCSAFAQAVFRNAGISIGRTTYTQFAAGRRVERNDIQPGDLVFFNYPGERSPGHVGIAVGGGMMVHDHGASRGVQHQGIDWSAYVGARCYITGHVHRGARTGGGGGGGGGTAATGGGGTTGGIGGGALTVGSTAPRPPGWKGATVSTIISAKASVTAMLRDANEVIGGMAGPMDAIERAAEAHLKSLREHLHPHMTPADLARTRAEIARWGKVLNDEISAQTKRAKRAFDAAAKEMLRAFDRETAAGLKARAAPDETPTEALLRQMQESRDDASRQQALAAAIASGDQQAIADAQYDIQVAALEKQAAAERKAADEKAAKDQEDYQNARDDQRQALQDQLDDWNDWLTKKMKTWNQFWAWVKANPNGGGVVPNLGETISAPGFGGKKPPAGMPGSNATTPTGPDVTDPWFHPGAATGGNTFVTVTVEGSVLSEQDLAATVRRELLRTQNRTGALGF